jgi:RNase P protein component
MAHVRILIKRNINSLTRKIPYYKKPIGMKIVGVPKEPLSMAY